MASRARRRSVRSTVTPATGLIASTVLSSLRTAGRMLTSLAWIASVSASSGVAAVNRLRLVRSSFAKRD